MNPIPFPLERRCQRSLLFASRSEEDADDALEESSLPSIERHIPFVDQRQSPPSESISVEYALLAQSQFKIIAGATGAQRCALFFRKEHSHTGRLEFGAVAVYPENTRVWLVSSKMKCKTRSVAA